MRVPSARIAIAAGMASIKASRLELMADLFNVFNRANCASLAYEPYAVYPVSGENAFGGVFRLSEPFHARFGVRWSF